MKYYPLPTEHTKAQAVILAKGLFPTHHIPLSILKHNQDHIICCDGAVRYLSQHNIQPSMIIGDCDSISSEDFIRYKDIILKIDEQDTNDLTKTIHFCQRNAINSIIILGATGEREDHTLANIGLLTRYINIIDTISMITDHGIFNVIKEPCNFESYPGQQVSLFTCPPTEISTNNLKYPLFKQSFNYWWQGTLNECLSEEFQIETNAPCIIYRAF